MTWVLQNRLAFGHSAHRLAIRPPALAKPNPTVCSLACRWRLRSALRADQVSFSIESGPLLDNKALLHSYKLSYNCIDHHLHPHFFVVILNGLKLQFLTLILDGQKLRSTTIYNHITVHDRNFRRSKLM